MKRTNLREILKEIGRKSEVKSNLAAAISILVGAAARVSAAIADGSKNEKFADEGSTNVQGETQKFLDVFAHEAFMTAAASARINCVLSEEAEEVVVLDPSGTLALAIDPLDGSNNIAINGTIGTIFGLYPAVAGTAPRQFLRRGSDLLAAAYVVYGPRTELVLTFGAATKRFVLNGERTDWIFAGNCKIPESACEFAINASNHRHWSPKIRNFVNNCLDGKHGPYGADYNMRWLAALVGETHRILTRGGLFIYPADNRKGYEQGRLRYCYECAPISFLVEKAGGKASDGKTRILDLVPSSLHARIPFCFGSPRQMVLFKSAKADSIEASSPLFSERGLFRTQA